MIGKLDQRVTLREYSATADGAGGSTHTWADFAIAPDIWAEVTPLNGREAMTDGGVVATGMCRFKIRYRSDIDEKDGVVWGGEHYNIRRIVRQGSRVRYLEFDAERGAPR